MKFSETFIRKPVATTLLTAAIALAGTVAFRLLPVSPLPQVDFPTIQVSAQLPGASPETMASSVATPLERQFGRIAGVTQLTSSSSLGSTSITLQFDLSRNIDAAARDVQAAINAARGNLPSNLPNNPQYRKVNPADAPIMIIALSSKTVDAATIYDVASSILAQKMSQIEGVGQVQVGGGALPAVRVELNPTNLFNMGLSLEQVRLALTAANANRPKGQIDGSSSAFSLSTTDQLLKADQYRPLLIAYKDGAPVRLSDLGEVTDSVEDVRNVGIIDGSWAISMIISRQPGANIIDTVDRLYAALPQLEASMSPAIRTTVVMDRTSTIRASVHDVEFTMMLSIALVIMVVFVFLRNARATMIPGIVVPLSLIGTFGILYLGGYSIDNLSLMALTISTGFVVDDAIVVVENISRHLEEGEQPFEAAIKGAAGIGFTVLSMSTSLVAVFIPILLMAGLVGRLFREFAITLSAAIFVSLIISLTTTPMMCARLLKSGHEESHGPIVRSFATGFDWLRAGYERSLGWVLHHPRVTLATFFATLAVNIALFSVIPKGFFPQQDVGRLFAFVIADQDTSFQAMRRRLETFAGVVSADPAVQHSIAFAGGQNSGSVNQGRMFISLKPQGQRKDDVFGVMDRLRKRAARVPGASLYMQAMQDLSIGGRLSNAQFQYTLSSDNLDDLNHWAPILLAKLRHSKEVTDVSSDQQNNGLDAKLVIDRATASRLGITPQTIDNTLYDAFGQRQVSTMYTALNQYHVVMEVSPEFWQNPDTLKEVYIPTSSGSQVPLSSFTHYEPTNTPLQVNHQGQFPSVTISFNLADGVALGQAVDTIQKISRQVGLPASVRGGFAGNAQAFQDSLKNEPVLILAALLSVYIVLGILYESYIHPITILSTLPSAGVGALLFLMLFHYDLSIIALIGIILLIGIVKKNAIMMVDFALEVERREHKSSLDAIHHACLLRFRPIMMTTMAAMLGGLPLAIGGGTGSELRRPLGIAIVGGLIVSQMLTLYTTPIIYLYLDQLSQGSSRFWARLARAVRGRSRVQDVAPGAMP